MGYRERKGLLLPFAQGIDRALFQISFHPQSFFLPLPSRRFTRENFPRELVYLQLPLFVNPHSFFRGNYVIQYGFKYGITGTLREPIIASPSLQALRDSGTQFREQHPLLLITRSPRYFESRICASLEFHRRISSRSGPTGFN